MIVKGFHAAAARLAQEAIAAGQLTKEVSELLPRLPQCSQVGSCHRSCKLQPVHCEGVDGALRSATAEDCIDLADVGREPDEALEKPAAGAGGKGGEGEEVREEEEKRNGKQRICLERSLNFRPTCSATDHPLAYWFRQNYEFLQHDICVHPAMLID